MNAILLAAGLGTRLRPITDTCPKCLVPILGKPLLQYWLELLFEGGIGEVLINTHYLPEQVRAFCKASAWANRISLVHEENLLGTAGTIVANQGFLAGRTGLVAHADNLSRFSMAAFLSAHATRPAGAVMTMMTFDTDAPQSCGIVEKNAQGLVARFHEKAANPPGTCANGAVYLLEPEVVAFIASLRKPVVDLSTEVIPQFLGHIATYHNAGYHRDIGSPESLRAAEREYAELT